MLRRILMPVVALLALLPACVARPTSIPTAIKATATKWQATPTVAATATKTPGCSVVSLQPTPGPTQQSLIPASREDDQVSGLDTAAVTIIEYGDFQ